MGSDGEWRVEIKAWNVSLSRLSSRHEYTPHIIGCLKQIMLRKPVHTSSNNEGSKKGWGSFVNHLCPTCFPSKEASTPSAGKRKARDGARCGLFAETHEQKVGQTCEAHEAKSGPED